MAIGHRGSAVGNSTTATTSITVTIPASVQTDDLLFLVTANRNATTDPTVSDDDTGGNSWARITGQDNTGSGDVFWKRATSGSASKTVTVSNCTNSCSAVLTALSGCSTAATPYESATAEANASGNESHDNFSSSVDGAWACFAVINLANDNAVSSQSGTVIGAFSERAEHLNTGGDDCATCIATVALPTAGETGDVTWAQTNGITVSVAWVVLPSTGVSLTADAGSYALTGTAASLELSREVVAAAGSYALTGSAANLEMGREVVAGAGSYALTGTDATLTIDEAPGISIDADAGSYALSGTDANLEIGRLVSAAAGSYALSGTDAALSITDKVVVADAGSYALMGTDASLSITAKVVAAAAGAYELTGSDATFDISKKVVAAPGSYALTGTDAALELSREVAADAGSYALTGSAATLARALPLTAAGGSYALTGVPAGLELGRAVIAASGSYLLVGKQAALVAPGDPSFGHVRYWNGTEWIAAVLKSWNGSEWV